MKKPLNFCPEIQTIYKMVCNTSCTSFLTMLSVKIEQRSLKASRSLLRVHFSIIKWCNYYRLLLCATLHALPLISSSLLHFSLPDSLFMCNLTIAFFMQTNFLIFLVHLIFFLSTIIQNFQPRTSLSSAHNFYTILKFITSEC